MMSEMHAKPPLTIKSAGTGDEPPPAHASSATTAMRRRSLLASGVGNLLEWFDWTVYSVFAIYLSAALFDHSDPTSALLSTLAVFAVGFVMRPLGGFVFARLADRKGRKWVLMTTMLLMAAGSLLIAVIPSYDRIGGLASLLLLLARLIQGFAHGGESTTSNIYLPEIAPRRHRALYGSAVAVAMGSGTLLATLFGRTLAGSLETSAMSQWGWRIPFVFGALLALVVLWLRRSMMESEVHQAQVEVPVNPGWTRKKIVRRAVQIFIYMAGTTLPYYVWSSYAAVFAVSARGMAPADAFTATLGATLAYIVLVPLLALLADRIGRRPPVLVYYIGTAALTVPMLAMISDQGWTLLVAQTVMMALSACVGATQPAMIAEQVPTAYRAVIMGTAMPLAVALCGGTAPYLNSWLNSIGLGWLFSTYTIALCLAGAVVVWRWKETRGINLREVV